MNILEIGGHTDICTPFNEKTLFLKAPGFLSSHVLGMFKKLPFQSSLFHVFYRFWGTLEHDVAAYGLSFWHCLFKNKPPNFTEMLPPLLYNSGFESSRYHTPTPSDSLPLLGPCGELYCNTPPASGQARSFRNLYKHVPERSDCTGAHWPEYLSKASKVRDTLSTLVIESDVQEFANIYFQSLKNIPKLSQHSSEMEP